MEALYNIINSINQLNNNMILFKTMSKNPHLKKLVTELNTKKQLEFGELSTGEILPNYSINSQLFYGKPDIPIQLKDTGEFWRSFEVILEDNGFIITADDDKGEVELFEKYSEDVAGLTSKNMSIFVEALIPKVYDVVIQYILKKN
jgi:hypothetical protein